jgi:hypothetical protein
VWELSVAGGVEPVLPPLEEPVCSISIAFLCAFLAFGMAYVKDRYGEPERGGVNGSR